MDAYDYYSARTTKDSIATPSSNATAQVSHENTTALVLLCLLSVFTVLSNGLVLISIAIERRLRTVFNCFIVNLAVGDLLVGAVVVPLFTVYKYLGYWPLDKIACIFWLAIDYVTCNVSLLTLCMISFDRCLGIRSPLRYLKVRSKRRRAVVCGNVAVWLVVSAFWVPGVPLTYINDPAICEQDMVTHRTYDIVTAVLCYYLPSCFLVVCQVLMLIRLKGTVKKKAFLTASHHSHRSSKQNGKSLSGKRRRAESESSVQSATGCDFSPAPVRRTPRTATGSCAAQIYSSQRLKNSAGNFPEISRPIPKSSDPSGRLERGTSSGSSPLAVRLGIAAVMKAVEEQKGAPRSRGLTFPLDEIKKSGHDESRIHTRSLGEEKRNNKTKVTKTSSLSDLFSSITKGAAGTTHNRHADGMCRRERAAIRTVIIITVVCLISWLPWYVVYMFLAFDPEGVPPTVYDTASWMAYGNSAVNPILYGYLNKDFRQVFKRILRLGKSGTQLSPPGSPNLSPTGTPRVTSRQQQDTRSSKKVSAPEVSPKTGH
ncbi:HRH1 [Branchiostoma lanceolatum]|uniref:HRH1 protein n=1 Tax=Branchiostoma lanceolatum TaxID=7740 RepID=A0A8K0EHQ6_BRALA|nr:HRH1 [Branchiostoma lanceolatum]